MTDASDTAAERLTRLIGDHIPGGDFFELEDDDVADLRTALAEHREMREQLTAFLDGAIPPYRPVSIPDMTDADRIRVLRNLLNTSIRLGRRRLARTLELRTDNERLRQQLDAMDTEWGVEWGTQRSVYPYENEATARIAAAGSESHVAMFRLVGDWQPAEEPES